MYEFCYPAYKTDQNFDTRVEEHSGSDKKWPVYNHLLECENFNYVVNLHSLPPSNNSVEYLEHVKFAIYGNTKIICNSQNLVELYFFGKPSHQMEGTKNELWH